MNINNHNYEEFFILYWDKELSAEQMKMVESFVEANKDLKEEFLLFGETRFTPDKNLVFGEKELLLINENSLIDFSNYPEQLLSYIDDELDADQKNEVEKFAAQHPAVQKELFLLQKTKFQPELGIVFPDKSTLYRREEKVRVINMFWVRVSVAAALILIAGLVTIRVINNNASGDKAEFVSTETPATQQETPDLNNQQTISDIKKEQPLIASAPVKKEIQKLPVENLIAKKDIIPTTENKNNLPIESTLIATNTNPVQANETSFPEEVNMDNTAIVIAQNKNNNTLFKNTTVTERPSPSYVMYDASDEPNENSDNGGLKGLLRKATRIFERHTKIQTTTDDNKLLVGVFAVSLK